jgi:hypothetical protein
MNEQVLQNSAGQPDESDVSRVDLQFQCHSTEIRRLIDDFHTARTRAKGLAVEMLDVLGESSELIVSGPFSEKLEELKLQVSSARSCITNLIGLEPALVSELIKGKMLTFSPGEQSFMRMIENGVDAYRAMQKIEMDLGVLDGSVLPGSENEKRYDLDRGYGNWYLGKILAGYIGAPQLEPKKPSFH